MPSKLGFGNSRKKAGKAEYGSSMHYKNPIKKKTDPVPAQGSMTYPNDDRITAVTEEDKIVQDKISKSGDGTEIGEKKKLIVQQYMATGHISDEDNQFLIDNQ